MKINHSFQINSLLKMIPPPPHTSLKNYFAEVKIKKLKTIKKIPQNHAQILYYKSCPSKMGENIYTPKYCRTIPSIINFYRHTRTFDSRLYLDISRSFKCPKCLSMVGLICYYLWSFRYLLFVFLEFILKVHVLVNSEHKSCQI
jgi:hypothetical protein